MMKPQTLVAACVTAVILSACSDSENEQLAGPVNPVDPPGSTDLDRRLKQFDNSEAFYTALRDALINQGDNQILAVEPIALPVAAPEAEAPGVATDEATSTTESSADSASGGTNEGGNEVTSTNVQEEGVDEQDRVKISSDGSRLFVLHSDYNFGPVAEPLEPAPDIAIDSTSLPAPDAYESVLRMMGVDAETPDTQSLAEISIDLQGRYADGFYLYENGADTKAIITSTGGGYWSNWAQPAAFAGLYSDISKVDVSDPGTAGVESSFKIDGQIVSSRRIGNQLIFASRYYPAIPGDQPWAQSQDQWENTVNTTDLSTLLPHYTRTDTDGEPVPLFEPAQCFVASSGEDQPYYSPDIITLGSINLDTMQLSSSQCFLGSTETLYASTEAVYLATTQYDYSEGPVTTDGLLVDVDDGPIVVDEPWSDPRVDTDIHQFDIDNGNLIYAGTGTVNGHLGWNPLRKPFRMSEHNGYLRVATMNDQQGPDHSPILLSVLEADGEGNLDLVSQLPNDAKPAHIGKPGEQLYASRFLGDRAYLVTFRQTDPLYVVDLSDPDNPSVLGELEIEGYSDYLHPIDANFMLGVGRDAVAAPDGFGDGRGALVQGIKLSLYDVSNPAAPAEIQSVLVGQRGTQSVALNNHRAIKIQRATDSHPTRVSFGIDVHGEAEPVSSPLPEEAFRYNEWSYTGLHGFDVVIGPGAGIVRRGAMVVETAGTAGNRYGPLSGDDRSEMVNDSVFYIHGKDVYAAHWDDLSNISPAR